MGEVYKARDTRLDRVVALKVSKSEFSERFEREARAVAALNHPRICQLYDVGPNYLVFEYVEGDLLKGPLPLEKALAYAGQICDALDAAHSKKITHRDLKPANIMVTKKGVKLLDFGLAKIDKPIDVAEETVTAGLTMKGQILGTLVYMSPEQLQGKEADSRSDLFSFGCVLYEMITGKRAFDGASPASVIAAILERPAPSVAEVAPHALDRVVKRCLEKDPEMRWQNARDLEAALTLVTAPEASLPAARPTLWMAATAAATIVAVLAAWTWWRQPALKAPLPLRFSLYAPPGAEFTNPFFGSAISPDGGLLAFTAQKKGAPSLTLWVRPMDSFAARELPGTENANGVFWSPDSKSIGFVANDKLKRIDVAGGAAQTLCDAPNFEGGSWSPDDVILFGSTEGGLRRVPAAGGTSTAVTAPPAREVGLGHRYPHFLPDGRSFLYTLPTIDEKEGGIFVASLDKPNQPVRLVASDVKAVYAPPRDGLPGYLLWLRDQALMAQPFDAQSKRMTGEPLPVADGVMTGIVTDGRRAAFSISSTGVLVYRGGGSAGFQLTWMSRDGKAEVVTGAAIDRRNGDPALSPDGRRVLLDREITGNFDVWLYELSRSVMTRLTFNPGRDWFAIWSPDGREIAFSSQRNGSYGIYRKDAGGGTQEELLVGGSKTFIRPSSWSRDGSYLLYTDGNDIYVLPLTGDRADRKPVPYLNTPFQESHPQFSPDGKWVAYVSNESGRDEIYTQTFPLSGGKWQVSNNQATEPRWRGDGKELFFLSGTKLWAASVRTSTGRVEIDPPHELFEIANYVGPDYHYDAARDGQRFLLTSPPGFIDALGPLNVVSDWQAGLKK